jgi:hypothetical protein
METVLRLTAAGMTMRTETAVAGDALVPVEGGGMMAGLHTTLVSPVATVQEFLFHLSRGSLPMLFDLLPARVVRQVGRDALAAVFSAALLQMRRRGGLRRVTYSGDASGATGATEVLVSVSMTFADSTVERSIFVVVREDGCWRVDLTR